MSRGARVWQRVGELKVVGGEWWVRVSAAITILLMVALAAGYRVNVSRSLPLGLYRVVGDDRDVRRGSVVIACLPEEWARFALRSEILGPGHCAGGSYGIGKVVVGIEEDVVAISREAIKINGIPLPSSRTVERDRLGRRMPHFPWGDYVLGNGEIWLFSPHPAGFDSRYFGPVPISQTLVVVQPVQARQCQNVVKEVRHTTPGQAGCL